MIMSQAIINKLKLVIHDLENPQHIITLLGVLDELERLYQLKTCSCKTRDAELEQLFADWEIEEREC
jgi:hypothetical protein